MLKPLSLDTSKLFAAKGKESQLYFDDIRGKETIKRFMEIAAAGGHNIILIGPPGAGKTLTFNFILFELGRSFGNNKNSFHFRTVQRTRVDSSTPL